MDLVTKLSILANWKDDIYGSILVIVDLLTKIMHYELVKITIDTPVLTEVIINIVVQHYGFPNSIVSNHRAIFTSKFWSSFYYFLGIKRQLFTIFYL